MAIAARSSITDITRIVTFITEACPVQSILTHIAELAQAPLVSLARESTLVLGEDAATRYKGILAPPWARTSEVHGGQHEGVATARRMRRAHR